MSRGRRTRWNGGGLATGSSLHGLHSTKSDAAVSSSSTTNNKSKKETRPRSNVVKKSTTISCGDATTISTGAANENTSSSNNKVLNLHTIPLNELETILVSWGYPKYRAQQVYHWIHTRGVTDVHEMKNLPQTLQQQLHEHAAVGSLKLKVELVSQRDGTIKRAYELHDGAVIESVLMGPYQDGRYTACISSQAGCAQGCVFCATGQMGFTRQLTPEEIFEQVSRFASELAFRGTQQEKDPSMKVGTINNDDSSPRHRRQTRLSNIVFMGMGEPLANYRNVVEAIRRIQSELGIGHRRITVSTVGIVPNIYKLAQDLPQVRLAVSLHCATDAERSKLLPANARYGGLDRLMQCLQDYVFNNNMDGISNGNPGSGGAGSSKKRRLTLEWALIEGENDTPETAHALGQLIRRWLKPRTDMVHVNVIPLNPTGGYGGARPSSRSRVEVFCQILQDQYGVACTPRVRRGIDINAGCGQLTAQVMMEEEMAKAAVSYPIVQEVVDEGVAFEDNDEDDYDDPTSVPMWNNDEHLDGDGDYQGSAATTAMAVQSMDGDDWEDYVYQSPEELAEASRLIQLVQGSTIAIHADVSNGDSTTGDDRM
jgi:23S rRNA (adenine2503-C2)-methyltransferase